MVFWRYRQCSCPCDSRRWQIENRVTRCDDQVPQRRARRLEADDGGASRPTSKARSRSSARRGTVENRGVARTTKIRHWLRHEIGSDKERGREIMVNPPNVTALGHRAITQHVSMPGDQRAALVGGGGGTARGRKSLEDLRAYESIETGGGGAAHFRHRLGRLGSPRNKTQVTSAGVRDVDFGCDRGQDRPSPAPLRLQDRRRLLRRAVHEIQRRES